MDVINLILEIIDLYLIGGIKPPHLMWPIKVMLHPWFIHVASGLSSSPVLEWTRSFCLRKNGNSVGSNKMLPLP